MTQLQSKDCKDLREEGCNKSKKNDMNNWQIEKWAAHIRTFISKDDFYKLKYYLDAWDIPKRKECVDYKVLGSTALLKACELERYNIIRYLVEECLADLDLESDAFLTPLYIACSHGDLYLAEYLIKRGANISWTGSQIRTYLMLFIENGTLCRFLISNGIDISKKDICCKTAFDYALEKCALVSLEMLIKCGEDINGAPFAREMPIAVACRNSSVDLLEYLISNGGNIDYFDDHGRTYLMNHTIDYAVCEVLICNGINVNAKDSRNKSALHYAVEKYAPATLWLLLTNNANVFAKDTHGKSALHYAVESKYFDIVDCLLSCGADPNTRNSIGHSVIQYAIDSADLTILRRILDYGGDVNSADDLGVSAIHYAVNTKADTKIVALLLKFGAMINSKNADEKTALHLAVESNNLTVTKFLLTHGADINCVDQKGKSPLHYAVRWCHSEMVSLLLKYGADLNAKDSDGIGPMQDAAILKKNSVVENLLQHLSIYNISKIESYELMAANCFVQSAFGEAFEYLSTAITWREINGLVVKPITKVNSILNNTREPETYDALMSLSDDTESVLIQAAVIKARILGPHHTSVVDILQKIADGLDDMEELVLIRIKQHNLTAALKRELGDGRAVADVVEELTQVLYCIDPINVGFKDIIPSVQTIMHAFDKVVRWKCDLFLKEKCYFRHVKQIVKNGVLSLYICFTMALYDEEIQTARKYLRRFFETCPDKGIIDILFGEFDTDDLPICMTGIKSFVEMAIAHRCPTNTTDADGSTPLHILLSRIDTSAIEQGYDDIVRLFLKSGTHLCKTNRAECSVLDLLKFVSYPICKVKDRTLQCIAADVVMNNNIPFENIVPVHLIPFIKDHGIYKGD